MMIELRMMMMMRMLMRLGIRRLEVGDNGNQIENRRKQLDKTPASLGEGKGATLAYSAELGSIQSNPIQSLSHAHTHTHI